MKPFQARVKPETFTSVWSAYQMGARAQKEGKTPAENPFHGDLYERLRRAWFWGYRREEADKKRVVVQ